MVVGCWLLVVGCWLFVVGCWLLAHYNKTCSLMYSDRQEKCYTRDQPQVAVSACPAFRLRGP